MINDYTKKDLPILINLFGGPCTGKSTTALLVAGELMRRGIRTEYVSEYAKNLTYEGRMKLLQSNQLYVMAKQEKYLQQAYRAQDVVVTDSPFIMGLAYYDYGHNMLPYADFEALVTGLFAQYNSVNFLLKRDDCLKYSKVGRNQTEEQAKELDGAILQVLKDTGIRYYEVPAKNAYGFILTKILERLEGREWISTEQETVADLVEQANFWRRKFETAEAQRKALMEAVKPFAHWINSLYYYDEATSADNNNTQGPSAKDMSILYKAYENSLYS